MKWSLCASPWHWLLSVENQGFSFVKSEGGRKTPTNKPNQNSLLLIQTPPWIILACFLACKPTMGMGLIFHGNIKIQLAVFWAWYFLHFSSQLTSFVGKCDLSQFRGGFTLKAKLCDHPHSYNSHSGSKVQLIDTEKHQPCRADPWLMLRLALLHPAPATGWGKGEFMSLYTEWSVAPASPRAPPSLEEALTSLQVQRSQTQLSRQQRKLH